MNYSRTHFSQHPFSWRGRFSRLSYLAWGNLTALLFFMVGWVNVMYIIYTPNIVSTPMSSLSWLKLLFPIVIAALLLGYSSIVFTIRRLHDLNLSGWLFLLLYVPVIGSLFWLYTALAKGTEGRNSYGFPRDTLLWEGLFGILTAICLLATFGFIIGYVALHPNSENIAILSRILK